MKEHLRQLLGKQEFEEIAAIAVQKKRVLSVLVSLTFDTDPLIAWRAVEAFGDAADRIAEKNPQYVRTHLRRLQWLMSDESGGVCWYAPQAMAEIIHRRPVMFSDYAAIVISFIHTVEEEDLAQFRPGILWAIGRLAPVARDEVEAVVPHIEACLDHRDPRVRGLAVWCLKQAGRQSLIEARADLASDDGPVELYRNGRLENTSVRALASR